MHCNPRGHNSPGKVGGGGGEDYATKFYGEARPELQRHSHFKYASFDRKGTPFVYIPLTMVPLWLT